MNFARADMKQGIVLVAVLWVVVLLAAIAAVIAASSRIESRMCLAEAEQMRAKWAMRAGVEKAIAVLTDDDKATDALTDIWADNAEELSDIELDGCTLTISISDECGKLNINAVTLEQLLALDGMTDEIADAIIDWRDSDDTEQTSGAEAGYYLNLKHPYAIRNGNLKTLRELLLAKGVTDTMFYGDGVLTSGWKDLLTVYSYENNNDSAGNRRTNINTASQRRLQSDLGLRPAYARWITRNRSRSFTSIGGLLTDSSPKQAKANINDANDAEPMDLQAFAEISDKIRTSNATTITGRINVNTASRDVLTAFFEDNSDLADAVIAARGGLGAGFESPGAIIQSGAMSLAQFRQFVNNMAVRSNVFTIKCTVTSQRTGAKYESEAVVDRGQEGSPILYWHN
jgi:type II secretory pathway component PulK